MKIDDDDFQYWLAHMDDALEEFFDGLPPNVRDRLDYSIDSLDVLEAWLLERYPDYEDTRPKSEALVLDGAARYIGETFRKTIGGRWWVDPEGKTMGGLPLIMDCRTGGGGMCPISMATTSTDRRWGNFSSGLLRKQLDRLSGKQKRMDFLLPAAKRFKMKTVEEKDFDYWLKIMDRALSELLAELPAHVRDRLDYSPASLDVLEEWLLGRYADGEAIRAETEIVRMDGVARYIGETLRRNVGGRWWFDLDGWSHDGLPQIADMGPGMSPVCPLALAREAAEVRCKNLFSTVLKSCRSGAAGNPGRG